MREIRPSGSEGGARLTPRPYPYMIGRLVPLRLVEDDTSAVRKSAQA